MPADLSKLAQLDIRRGGVTADTLTAAGLLAVLGAAAVVVVAQPGSRTRSGTSG